MTADIDPKDVQPGQVYFAQLEPTRGHEQRGDRPVLVVSSREHLAMWRGTVAVVVPLTTQKKPLRFRPKVVDGSWAICDQPRTLDVAERFRRRAKELDPDAATFAGICDVTKQMLS